MDVLQSLRNRWNHLSLMTMYLMAMIANLQTQTFQKQLSQTQLDLSVLQQTDSHIPMDQIGLTVQSRGSKWDSLRFVSTFRPATYGNTVHKR